MNAVSRGVCAPRGFRASGVAAGVKPGSTKKDCALVASDAPAAVAGTFTKNLMKAPPVKWSEAVCVGGLARAVFINSGNANAATGSQGLADAQETAAWTASGLGLQREEVCVCSTGVIGVPLPMERIRQGVEQCLAGLSAEGSANAAQAIMTTDTVPKEMAVEIPLEGGPIRIGAIAKGSGMIAPNMATMICVITTDAAIDAEPLSGLLRHAVDASFNCICVDNDMSTSDTVLCLANGLSPQGKLLPGSPAFDAFGEGLAAVCLEMAHKLVKDGEGATKFVEIAVNGAVSDEDAKTIARAIAHSQLCKTAFFGQDPNWGRFACAAGYAGPAFDPADLALWIDDLQLVRGGMPADYAEADAAAIMQKPSFRIRVEVGTGPGKAIFWTSDLSHDYVSINADYRS